jgi:hypothetical protein
VSDVAVVGGTRAALRGKLGVETHLGGILASGATDPNSGPLLALLALTYWPARPASYWRARPVPASLAAPLAPPAAAEGNLAR